MTTKTDVSKSDPHSHLVETGVGALLVGAVATTAGAVAAGPLGAAVGAAIGGVAGGALGHNYGDRHEHQNQPLTADVSAPTAADSRPGSDHTQPPGNAFDHVQSVPQRASMEHPEQHVFSETRSAPPVAHPAMAELVKNESQIRQQISDHSLDDPAVSSSSTRLNEQLEVHHIPASRSQPKDELW